MEQPEREGAEGVYGLETEEGALEQALIDLQERFAQTVIGITFAQYKRLTAILRTEELITVLELLRCRRHRSSYRERQSQRIRVWLDNPRSVGRPLDAEAIIRCTPRWPITFSIPNRADAQRLVANRTQ